MQHSIGKQDCHLQPKSCETTRGAISYVGMESTTGDLCTAAGTQSNRPATSTGDTSWSLQPEASGGQEALESCWDNSLPCITHGPWVINLQLLVYKNVACKVITEKCDHMCIAMPFFTSFKGLNSSYGPILMVIFAFYFIFIAIII